MQKASLTSFNDGKKKEKKRCWVEFREMKKSKHECASTAAKKERSLQKNLRSVPTFSEVLEKGTTATPKRVQLYVNPTTLVLEKAC